ncbi:MAG TPA: hypothetical protein DCQ96_00715, partial [Verrucomicrobiales bacterium]|nr:hypothetical protein [Verrucomicrobiales bacterium]
FQPSPEERAELMAWIESNVLKLDPENPDPGRVTIRRLNREEYRNTIWDLLGVEYNVDDNFPPDDTGFGFDTIGDVLTISPLLLEKYLLAAETIADLALPATVIRRRPITIDAGNFRSEETISKVLASWKLIRSIQLERRGGSAKPESTIWRLVIGLRTNVAVPRGRLPPGASWWMERKLSRWRSMEGGARVASSKPRLN